jgi:hypothetical protein
MAVNEKLSFTHLNGMQAETDQSVAREWDRAFTKATGKTADCEARTRTVSSWDKAFRRVQS